MPQMSMVVAHIRPALSMMVAHICTASPQASHAATSRSFLMKVSGMTVWKTVTNGYNKTTTFLFATQQFEFPR